MKTKQTPCNPTPRVLGEPAVARLSCSEAVSQWWGHGVSVEWRLRGCFHHDSLYYGSISYLIWGLRGVNSQKSWKFEPLFSTQPYIWAEEKASLQGFIVGTGVIGEEWLMGRCMGDGGTHQGGLEHQNRREKTQREGELNNYSIFHLKRKKSEMMPTWLLNVPHDDPESVSVPNWWTCEASPGCDNALYLTYTEETSRSSTFKNRELKFEQLVPKCFRSVKRRLLQILYMNQKLDSQAGFFHSCLGKLSYPGNFKSLESCLFTWQRILISSLTDYSIILLNNSLCIWLLFIWV